MTAPAPLDAAIEQISEAVAVSRTAINKWIVDDRRVPKADLVGYLVLLADLVDSLLAALSANKRLEEAGRERVPVNVSRWDDDTETMSFDGTTFTTVRPCRDCGVLICGGPTRCLYCAAKEGRP